ncbi:MAG TPA: tetratricopeptide repeat protein, partial [Longimicrobiales bacterium]|nr:tetratricopeptide repeat protein [Longimicrobiales bacterium]
MRARDRGRRRAIARDRGSVPRARRGTPPSRAARVLVLVAGLCLPALAPAPPRAGAQEDIFREGSRLSQEGQYQAALEAWERIREAGYESAALHFNLGNVHFKLGHLGPAILEYERAERLAPGDQDVAENLRLARSVTADDIEPLPRFWLRAALRWVVDPLPLRVLRLVVAGAWVLTGAAVVLRILSRTRGARRLASRTAWVLGGITVLFGLNLAVRELGIGAPEEAVVMVREVGVKSAPT